MTDALAQTMISRSLDTHGVCRRCLRTEGIHADWCFDKPEEHFETLWRRYIVTLKRGGGSQGVKSKARKSYDRALKKVPQEDLDIALDKYTNLCRREGRIGTCYVMQAQTWFSTGWEQHIEPDPTDGLIERLRDL